MPMLIGKPAPFVSAFVAAVDEAIRAHQPSFGMSAMQRAWLVFLVLVTPKISMPVGFVFYQPAPELSAWYKQEKVLKQQGVPPKQRPPKPAPNAQYPTKQQRALRLLAAFKAQHPDIRVHCIAADALYGTGAFVREASALFEGVQVL